jgi:hypothetical protein
MTLLSPLLSLQVCQLLREGQAPVALQFTHVLHAGAAVVAIIL